MSEYELPPHIQEEIMKRLPVKSLLQFRSVSKAWMSLIDSSEFIAAHSLHRHTQQQHLLVSYEYLRLQNDFYSFIDDDTFPQQWSKPTLPLSVKQLKDPRVVGSSQGVVCLYKSFPILETEMAVLWNPSIRKSIVVAVPGLSDVGFGVCPVTSDPKIVWIKQSWDRPHIETSYRCEVMVYTLSSGKWKTLSTRNLPNKPLRGFWRGVVSERFIYWLTELPTHKMIVSFDVTNESFEVIDLPNCLARHNAGFLYISELRESAAMIECRGNNCTVWMMEHGAQRSFTKLFTIETPYKIVGFRKSGVPIMEVKSEDDGFGQHILYQDHSSNYQHCCGKEVVSELGCCYGDNDCELVVYEPNSEHSNVLESFLPPSRSFLNSYTETLLLLGRSDCLVIDIDQGRK